MFTGKHEQIQYKRIKRKSFYMKGFKLNVLLEHLSGLLVRSESNCLSVTCTSITFKTLQVTHYKLKMSWKHYFPCTRASLNMTSINKSQLFYVKVWMIQTVLFSRCVLGVDMFVLITCNQFLSLVSRIAKLFNIS